MEPTEEGRAVRDRTVGTQAIREARIVLDAADRAALYRLLRILMRAFPGTTHGVPSDQGEPEE